LSGVERKVEQVQVEDCGNCANVDYCVLKVDGCRGYFVPKRKKEVV
jgi:hypothetical protein